MTRPLAAITPGVTLGHVAHSLDSLDLTRSIIPVKAVADGVTNDTLAVTDAMDEADPGDVLLFPRGAIVCEPIVMEKCLHFVGAGKYSTRLVPPVSATTDPIINIDLTVDSGFGIYDNWGASIADLGVDLTNTPDATGIATNGDSTRFKLRDVLVNGGYRSLSIEASNGTIDNLVLLDASDCFMYITQAGLELRMRDVYATLSTGTLDAYFKVDITGGGFSFGALYMDNFQGNSGGAVNHPFIIEAASPGTFFCFMRQVILDNCSEAAVLTNVSDVNFMDGYVNCAAGAGNAVFEITQCHNLKIRDNRLYGGAGGGTYEFLGAISYGFDSRRNTINTTPAYKISTATKPTEIYVDDWMPGASDIGQITNDEAWFQGATQRMWGPRGFMNRLTLSSTPTIAYPAAYEGAMVAGSVTLPAEDVLAAYSRFIPFRVTQGGTLGDLTVASINEGADTVTITSTSAAETSTIGYLRYELPH